MNAKKIAILIGSLRTGSFNRKVAKAVIALAPETLALEIVEIGQLQLYNQDLDVDPPKEWKEFREKIREFDGILFFTPEYNRSFTAVLKNALDIGSRPPAKSVWSGKPGGIVSVSPGRLGGFGANHHLRQVLFGVNIHAMIQPEAYISDAAGLFNENEQLIDEHARTLLTKFINSFAEWVER
ncbi:MAG: NAD(P)H-dependent oxidoreductase [Paludibacter sp.]|nr:NAD(P)H-dependent oxidoreductase [Paludibacter sp.]